MKNQFRITSLVSTICILIFILSCSDDSSSNTDIDPEQETETEFTYSEDFKAKFGITHAGGKYHFTDKPYIIEGAEAIEDIGVQNIKLWLTQSSQKSYYYNSTWPSVSSLKELLQTEYYNSVLRMPFKTYAFVTTAYGKPKWKDGLSTDERDIVYTQIYDAAKYLLEEFSGEEKTFIIQNWEGDNLLSPDLMPASQWDTAIQGMIDWLNVRQEAVTDARNDVPSSMARVINCGEVNNVLVNGYNYPRVIDKVMPFTNLDLYSLSSWGTKTAGTEKLLLDKLDYIASKVPANDMFGDKNIMVGEFGCYEGTVQSDGSITDYTGEYQKAIVKNQLEYALQWGAQWVFYWQLYDNGLRKGVSYVAGKDYTNSEMVGTWTIRADGSYTPTYNFFKEYAQSQN